MDWMVLLLGLLAQSLPLPAQDMVLPDRFAVPVRLNRQLDPSRCETGTAVELEISHDVRWHGCLVFREGAPVLAVISEARGPGVVGRPSLLVLHVQRTTAADGTSVPLSGTIRAEGEDRTMESIGAAAGVCCLGIFLPGGRQMIGKGVGTVALTTTEVRIQCSDDS